jgi:probable F420-dependent oxidoreductase
MTPSSLEAVTPALSIQLRNFAAEDPGSWQPLLDRVRAADEAGVDRLVVSDHVVFGERLDEYGRPEVGGSKGGKQPTGPDGQWLDPLTLLTVVAGITSHARLATGILIAALRRPIVLAKMTSTLDVLSGGRLDLGVGVGWQREEYEAAGLSFEGRGRLLDHTLEVCQTVWRETNASYASDELTFDHIHQMPKPLQSGGVPIWISGTLNRRVVDRVVRFGSGWIPWGDDIADPAKGIGVMREALEAAGRGDTKLQVTTGLPVAKDAGGNVDLARTMDGVPPLVEAGITDFRSYLPIPSDPSAARDALSELVGAFRAAVGRA